VVKREDQLLAKRDAVGQARKFDNTNIVERAASAALGPATLTEARTVWRSLSGAAHGLVRSMLGRTGTQQTSAADGEGVAGFRSGGDLDASLNASMLAYRLSAKGWEILDLRGAGPASVLGTLPGSRGRRTATLGGSAASGQMSAFTRSRRRPTCG
jgi:hypothetical protein